MAFVVSNSDSGTSLMTTPAEEMEHLTIEEIMGRARKGRGPDALIDLRVGGASRAACVGRLDLLQYFIETQNVPVNTITEAERDFFAETKLERARKILMYTLLSCAIELSYDCCDEERIDEMVTYLLERNKKEELETRLWLGRSCLMVAAIENNFKAVRKLVALGANIHACCDQGHRAICLAFQRRNADMIIFLLEQLRVQGEEVWQEAIYRGHCLSPDCTTLLFVAIRFDVLPVIQYLVQKEGKDILRRTLTGPEQEILPQILKWIFSQGLPLDLTTVGHSATALHIACTATHERLHSNSRGGGRRKPKGRFGGV